MRLRRTAVSISVLLILSLSILGTRDLVDIGGFVSSAQAQENDDATPGGPPPLKINKDAPLLLLDEPKDEQPENKASLRLNHACFVCHTNYKVEKLVNIHAEQEIGCMDCHGESFEHRNDEDNITPPDVMYPQYEISDACKDCHDEHDVWPEKVIDRWLKRCPDKKDIKTLVCTDCHGHHRLERRVVRWNKATGELIVNEKKPDDK